MFCFRLFQFWCHPWLKLRLENVCTKSQLTSFWKPLLTVLMFTYFIDTTSSKLRKCLEKFRVRLIPHNAEGHGGNTQTMAFLHRIVKFFPLTLFGLCAVLLGVVFEAPGAFTCINIINYSNWTLPDSTTAPKLKAEVLEYYRLVISYAFLKPACITIQVGWWYWNEVSEWSEWNQGYSNWIGAKVLAILFFHFELSSLG